MYRQRPNWWASWHIFVAFVKHLQVRHTLTFFTIIWYCKNFFIHRMLEQPFIKYLGTANSLHASRLTVSVHWRNFGDVSSFSLIALKLKRIRSKYLVCSKSGEFSPVWKRKNLLIANERYLLFGLVVLMNQAVFVPLNLQASCSLLWI